MGFGDFFLGSEGTAGEHGIDTTYYDDYADYQGIRGSVNDYWSGIMQGEEPEWMRKYLPSVLQEQYADLNRTYLGDPGDRGNSAMGIAEQVGAQTGIGPKSTVAQTGKVNYELAAKKAAANAAMQKYRATFMGNAANQGASPQGLMGLPQGQRVFSSGYNIQPQAGTEGFLSKAGGAVAQGAGMAMGAGVAGAMPGFGSGGQFEVPWAQ